MDKLERLMNLVAALIDTQVPLTAEQIRQRVPGYPDEPGATFHRAFERDKDDLRELGIPVRVERIGHTDPPTDGYRIPAEDYYLTDPGLAPDELAAIQLATAAVDLGDLDPVQALWKLGGQTVVEPPDRAPVARITGDANLGRLFGAVAERRTVTFTYRDEARRVDPYRLDYQRGRWYLTGHDHDRDAERNFRLDRVDGEVALTSEPESFPPPPAGATGPSGAARPAWEFGEAETVTARLRVDRSRVHQARQVLGPAVTSDAHDDGSVTFAVPVNNPEAFRSLALSFLDHAEVEGPAELRADMIAWLEAIAEP